MRCIKTGCGVLVENDFNGKYYHGDLMYEHITGALLLTGVLGVQSFDNKKHRPHIFTSDMESLESKDAYYMAFRIIPDLKISKEFLFFLEEWYPEFVEMFKQEGVKEV